jgi:ornithine cyclodeaminase
MPDSTASLQGLRLIDAQAARQYLPFDRLIATLAEYFAEGCQVPLRHRHEIGTPGGRAGSILIMPAWRPGGLLGIKTIAIFPDNAAHGLPGLHSVYLLMDASTGVPLALMDGNEITARRTAAASALAARYLARQDAGSLLVLGAGRIGRLLPHAYRAVLPIHRVRIWVRRAGAAGSLVEELRGAGFDAAETPDLQSAVGAADIVSCATLSEQPLVRGAWLRPGMHLDLIGSFTPAMRESDAACFVGTRVFADTEEAVTKAGDLLQAIASGAFAADRIEATLAQLCRGEHAGRCDVRDITVFKSVGSALEDLAAATLVYRGVAPAGFES